MNSPESSDTKEKLEILKKKSLESINIISEKLSLDKSIFLNNLPQFEYIDEPCSSEYIPEKNIIRFGRVLDRVASHETGHYIHFVVKQFFADNNSASTQTFTLDKEFDRFHIFYKSLQECMARFCEGLCGVNLVNRWDTTKKIEDLEKELANQSIVKNSLDYVNKKFELYTLKELTVAKNSYDKIIEVYLDIRENDLLRLVTNKNNKKWFFNNKPSTHKTTFEDAATSENLQKIYADYLLILKQDINYKIFYKLSRPELITDNSGEQLDLYKYAYLYHWIGEQQGQKLYESYASGNANVINAVKKLMTIKHSSSFWLLESYAPITEKSLITKV